MGKFLRPFLVDQDEYTVFLQFMERTVGFFNNEEGLHSVNQTVDADYIKWVKTFDKGEPGNEKILGELEKFLHDASEKPGISALESESINDLTKMVKAAVDLRKLIASDLGNTSIQQRMLEIGNLIRVLGGEDSPTGQKKPSFEDTLRTFNKATGFQYVKKDEFKALCVLKDQVNKAVINYEHVAIIHINRKADEFIDKQHECVDHVMAYNTLANDYLEHMETLGIRSETMEGNVKLTEEKIAELQVKYDELEKIYGEKVAEDNKLAEKIQDEKGNLEFFVNREKELTQKAEEAQDKFNKADGESKVAEGKKKVADGVLETAKSELKAAEEEVNRCIEGVEKAKTQLPTEEEIKDYLDSIGSQMDKLAAQQKAHVAAIEENTGKIETLKSELETERARYSKEISDITEKLVKEAGGIETKDEERYKELQDARKVLKNRLDNSPLLNGFRGLSLKDTNALIEGLRVNDDLSKKEDLSDMGPKKVDKMESVERYYTLLKTYRDVYNVVHKGEPKVDISGKMLVSRSRTCSVGTKAAIDFLNSTIKNEKSGEMDTISNTLRTALLNLQKEIDTAQANKKEIENAIKLRAEKAKLEDELRQVEEKYKTEIGKVSRSTESKRAEITGLAEKISTERTKEAEFAEAKRQEATKKLIDIAVKAAEEKVEKAKAKVEAAQVRAEEAQDASDELTLKAEELKAIADAANDELKRANGIKDDATKMVTDRTKMIQDYEAQKVLSEKARSLACSNSSEVEDQLIHYKEGLKTQKDLMEDLKEKREACQKELDELDLERSNVGQTDNRYQSIVERINKYCEDVEDGNEKKPDGSWKHKNGSHYKALKEGLLKFQTDLKNGGVQDMKAELEKLQALSDGYLEARSHDFGARLTGGSQFRHNRLNFVTGIRNFCQAMAFPSTMKPTSVNNIDKTYLMRKDELLLEPNIAKRSIIQSNQQMVEPDNFTVIDDDILFLSQSQNADVEEQNVSMEKNYDGSLLEAGLQTWLEQEDELVENGLNKQDEIISENELNEPVLGGDDNTSMTINLG